MGRLPLETTGPPLPVCVAVAALKSGNHATNWQRAIGALVRPACVPAWEDQQLDLSTGVDPFTPPSTLVARPVDARSAPIEAMEMNDLLVARLSAQGGLVTALDARSCGYTSTGLRRLVVAGDLFRARAGCFVDGRLLDGASPERRHALMARAVSRGYRQPHAISHISALAVMGLPLLNITADVVHLTLTGPGCARTRPGLRVHPELPDSVARQLDGDQDGSKVVHPAVAIVQSAALAGITAGVAAADAAMHSGQVTREDLEIALRVARLGPGRADARAAVDLAEGLTESPGESWTRVLLVSLGLPKVEPQVVIRDQLGRFVARVDFLFRAQRTIVEFDGLLKYGGADGRQALVDEKRREDALRALGYQVMRLTWRDLHKPASVKSLVMEAFSRA